MEAALPNSFLPQDGRPNTSRHVAWHAVASFVRNPKHSIHNFSITLIELTRGLGASEVGTSDWKKSQSGLSMRKRYNSKSLDLSDAFANMLSEAMDSLDHEHDKVSTHIDPDTADFVMMVAVMLVGILAVSCLA
jgi:hypothetical protein